jgi:hypothetical protein
MRALSHAEERKGRTGMQGMQRMGIGQEGKKKVIGSR